MRWTDIPFNPRPATLRWFVIFLTVALTGIAARQFFFHNDPTTAGVLLVLALGVGPLGLIFPAVLRPVFVVWMVLVYPIHWVISHLILAILFYCIFTPLGLFFKLLDRDPLTRRFRGDQETYWVEKPAAEDVRRYFRQS